MARHRPEQWASEVPDREPPGKATEAFEAAVRMHYVRLSRFAFRMLNSWDAAEDAVQEALFRCWTRRESITLGDPLPYFYRAVRNECLRVIRRQRLVDSHRMAPAGERYAPDADRSEELEATLNRAIEALPERPRQVFTMSREQDLTYAQIAELLGISVKTVETHMGRALKALRHALADYLGTVLLAVSATHSLLR